MDVRTCVCEKQILPDRWVLELAGFLPPLFFLNQMCPLIKFAEEPSVSQASDDPLKVYKERLVAQ